MLCELRNSNWVFGSMLLVIICGIKRLKINLSKTFENNGKRLIGLNEVGVFCRFRKNNYFRKFP